MQKFSGGGPSDPPPFFRKFSMTVAINQKKFYYNYYTSGKFLALKFKFQVKFSDTPPPSPPNFRCFATSLTESGYFSGHEWFFS